MTSREKVRRALAHQPGPVPVDFGSTGLTGMHVSCVAALRAHYGLPPHPVRVTEPYQMLGEVEDDLAKVLGSDCVGANGRGTMFGFPLEGLARVAHALGSGRARARGFRTRQNEAGDVYLFPEGDTSVAPSGHLPASGYFFDAIVRQEPIDEDKLDPADNCEEFKLLSPADIAHWRHEFAKVRGEKAPSSAAWAARASATSRSCPRRFSSIRRASAMSASGISPSSSAATTCTRSSGISATSR